MTTTPQPTLPSETGATGGLVDLPAAWERVTAAASAAGALVVPVLPELDRQPTAVCGSDIDLLDGMLKHLQPGLLYARTVTYDADMVDLLRRAYGPHADDPDDAFDPGQLEDDEPAALLTGADPYSRAARQLRERVETLLADRHDLTGALVQLDVHLVHNGVVHHWCVTAPAWEALLEALQTAKTDWRTGLQDERAGAWHTQQSLRARVNAFMQALPDQLLADETFLRLPNAAARRAHIDGLVEAEFGAVEFVPMPSPVMLADTLAGPVRQRKDDRIRALRAQFPDLAVVLRSRLAGGSKSAAARNSAALDLLKQTDDWVASTVLAKELLSHLG